MELNIVGGSFIGLSNDVKTRSKRAASIKNCCNSIKTSRTNNGFRLDVTKTQMTLSSPIFPALRVFRKSKIDKKGGFISTLMERKFCEKKKKYLRKSVIVHIPTILAVIHYATHCW
jgi:hypothetical protein